MIKLYHLDRSPFGWKVRIVLAEKDVPHEAIVPEDKAHDPSFLRLNPFGLTPVLEIGGGRAVYESTVVCEYLEDAFPEPPMLPRDPWERARVRMIEDTTDQYFYAALREFRGVLYDYEPPHLIPKPEETVDRTALETATRKLHEHLARLESQIEGRTWFGGATFSLADAALVPPLVGSLRVMGVLPDARYPGIALWTARALERPSVRESAPKVPVSIRR